MLRSFLFLFVFSLAVQVHSQENEHKLDSLIKMSNSSQREIQLKANLALAEMYALEDSIKMHGYLEKVNPIVGEFPDSTRREILYEKVELLKKVNELDSAKAILKKELKIAEQQNDLVEQAGIHKNLSSCYFFGFEFDSTMMEVETAADLYLKLKDSTNYGNMLLRIGNIYYIQGNYEKAIEYGIEAKNIFLEIGLNKQLAISFLHVGNIFFLLKDYKNAGDFYKRAYSFFDEVDDSLGKARTLLNHGLVYIQTDQPEKAVEMFFDALPVIKKDGRLSDLSLLYNFLAEAHLELKQYDSTRLYIAKSKEIDLKIGDRMNLSQNYLLSAHMDFELGKLDSAEIHAQKALGLINDIESKERKKMIYEILYQIYEGKGDYEQAFIHMKNFLTVSDSLELDDISTRKKAMDERAKLETANYELKLLNQKKNLILQENKLQKQYLAGISLIAIFAIVLVILLFRSNNRNKELNENLQAKQNKIREDLKVKESLLKEIHHRVKNNLQIISSMLSIQNQYFDDPQFTEVISECKNRINSMSLIHESLYKGEDLYEDYFSVYVRKLMQQLMQTYCIDETKIKLKMEMEDFYLGLDDSVPAGLLINEIVSNSIKHAFPQMQAGVIEIGLIKSGDLISLSISDNGKGMGKKAGLENAETFGLLLISLLASQLNAEVKVDAENGTAYQISWQQREVELKHAV